MPGCTESNGTCIGEFPSLVLGTATQYHKFFQFGFGMDIGEFSSGSLVLGTTCCALGTNIGEFALAVPFLLCPVWSLLAAGRAAAVVQ